MEKRMINKERTNGLPSRPILAKKIISYLLDNIKKEIYTMETNKQRIGSVVGCTLLVITKKN